MTKLPRRLGGESPEQSVIRKVRSSGPGMSLWLRELCSRPSGLALVKPGSTRVPSPVPLAGVFTPRGSVPPELTGFQQPSRSPKPYAGGAVGHCLWPISAPRFLCSPWSTDLGGSHA